MLQLPRPAFLVVAALLLTLASAHGAALQAVVLDPYGDPYTDPVDPDPTVVTQSSQLPLCSDSDPAIAALQVVQLSDGTFLMSGHGTMAYAQILEFQVKISSGCFRVSILQDFPGEQPPFNPGGGKGQLTIATFDRFGNELVRTDSVLSWLIDALGRTVNNGSTPVCTPTTASTWGNPICTINLTFPNGNLDSAVAAKYTNTDWGDPSQKTIVLHSIELTSHTDATTSYSFSHRVKGEGFKKLVMDVYLASAQ